uniref:Uncharacterized protein n=1 Tax=Glossina palpalis gambiensis TaxID=67801 RepID=A0A1B0C766_9MUSC
MFSYLENIILQECQDKIIIIIIDAQGFYSANKFIPKEVCISASDDSQIKNSIIQPPFKYSKLMTKDTITNNWLCKHFHGLRWDDGNSTLTDVKKYLKSSIEKLTQNPTTVYVKGLEKLKWVKTLIGEEICILNLDDFNCSNVGTLYKTDTNTNTNLCNYKYKTIDHRTFFLKIIDELRIYNNLSTSPFISSSIYGLHRYDSWKNCIQTKNTCACKLFYERYKLAQKLFNLLAYVLFLPDKFNAIDDEMLKDLSSG